MNRKNIFRQVCQHAMGMTQKAMLNDSCSYRSPSGPCLIGSLINDEHYNTEFENEGANHELVIEALKKSSNLSTSNGFSDFSGAGGVIDVKKAAEYAYNNFYSGTKAPVVKKAKKAVRK